MVKVKLFEQLYAANDKVSIKNLIDFYGKHLKQDYFASTKNNVSALNQTKNPISGVAERITNMINAYLLRLKSESKKYAQILEKYDHKTAINKIFDLGQDGFSSFTDKQIKDFCEDKFLLEVCDSDDSKKPTLKFRDFGIGIKGDDFIKTVLKTQGNFNNELKGLSARYGMGGSTAIPHSVYTIIMSKPAFDNPDNLVYFTVVELVRDSMGRPSWVYYLDPVTNQIPSIGVSDEAFAPGTLIKHVNYDVNTELSLESNYEGSIKKRLSQKLFDLSMPLKGIENRSGTRREKGNVYIKGYKTTIENSNLLEYSEFNTIPWESVGSEVKVTCYVLKHKRKHLNPKEYKGAGTWTKHPYFVTLNGLSQGNINTASFNQKIGLPNLQGLLVINIDASSMQYFEQDSLFTSDREGLKDSEDTRQLLDQCASWISDSVKLQELNEEYGELNLIGIETGKAQSLLNQMLSEVANRPGSEIVPTPSPYVKPIDKFEYKKVPSYFNILKDEITAHPGRVFSIPFETDVEQDFLKFPNVITDVFGDSSIKFKSVSRLYNGKARLIFAANDLARPGMVKQISVGLQCLETKFESKQIISVGIEDYIKKESNKDPKLPKGWKNIKHQVLTPRDDDYPTYFGSDNEKSLCYVAEDAIYVNSENNNRKRAFRTITKKLRTGINTQVAVQNHFDALVSLYSYLMKDHLSQDVTNNIVTIDSNEYSSTEHYAKDLSDFIGIAAYCSVTEKISQIKDQRQIGVDVEELELDALLNN